MCTACAPGSYSNVATANTPAACTACPPGAYHGPVPTVLVNSVPYSLLPVGPQAVVDALATMGTLVARDVSFTYTLYGLAPLGPASYVDQVPNSVSCGAFTGWLVSPTRDSFGLHLPGGMSQSRRRGTNCY